MDPTSLSNLDPKLKETYDRVMGTSTPPASDQTPSNPAPASPTPADASPNNAPSENVTAESGLSTPIATPAPDSAEPQPATVTITQASPTPPSTNIVSAPHGHSGLIKIFYILGATVFFVIYIFFWAKIFNISLPF